MSTTKQHYPGLMALQTLLMVSGRVPSMYYFKVERARHFHQGLMSLSNILEEEMPVKTTEQPTPIEHIKLM